MNAGHLQDVHDPEVPLELQALSFSEYCNAGCFTGLAGEFRMLSGLVADIELKGRESQGPVDMTPVVNQQRYCRALEDQDPISCHCSTSLHARVEADHIEPRQVSRPREAPDAGGVGS